MKTKQQKKDKNMRKSAAKVRVYRWWLLADAGNCDCATYAVQLQDERYGFLKVSLERAFDGTGSWCGIDVNGAGGPVRYTTAEIDLPSGLRRQIACAALTFFAGCLASTLDEELIVEAPQFGTYLAARRLLQGGVNSGDLQEFSELIADPGAVGCSEEDDIRNMQRIAKECRKFMPSGINAAIPHGDHGVDD